MFLFNYGKGEIAKTVFGNCLYIMEIYLYLDN
jgi:hypothetical protein